MSNISLHNFANIMGTLKTTTAVKHFGGKKHSMNV